jgi:uncharacterized protein with NRDE domain
VTEELLRFLTTPQNSGAVESEVFITSELYGTRASTVIVASDDGISFVEKLAVGS